MIQKIVNYIRSIKDTIKKKRIIRLAKAAGCDVDGDIYIIMMENLISFTFSKI